MDDSAESDAVLHHIPGAALHVCDGIVIDANERARRLLGPPAEVLARMAAPDRVRLLAACDEAAVAGTGPEAPPIVVRLGASPPQRFVELALGVHPAGGVIALVHDVTERERLDAVIAEFATGVYLTDADLRATWIPHRVSESVGLPRDRFVGSDVYELLHPEDVEPTRELVARAREVPGVRCSRTLRVRQLDQPEVWWPIIAHLIWRGDDPALGGLLVRFDIDLAANVHVRGPEEAAQTLVTLGPSSATGALHLDLDGQLRQRSTRVREILRPVGDDADRSWRDLLRADHRDLVDERLDAARIGTLRPPVEVAFEHDGATVWAHLEVLPYRDAHGTVAGMFVNVTDLTSERAARDALAAAREELWHLANHDALTGLANRYQLADRLADALTGLGERAPVARARPGVIVGDLDRFKEVNDRHGHRVGDALLVEVARRLTDAVRADDLVCRFGGDEFVVLCERVDEPAQLEALAARVASCFDRPFLIDGLTIEVGMSVGAAIAEPDDAEDPDALILRADRAMYAAKAPAAVERRGPSDPGAT
jgi:diguanylate cyclase (GGDEF)-like protein/PAS domain S-box-containing protein